MIGAIIVKLASFLFAPIVVFFEKRDKILHFYVAYAIVFLGSVFWSGYWASMITIAVFILKEECWDRLFRFGHYDPMDLRWSLVGVLHSMFLYFLLRSFSVL